MSSWIKILFIPQVPSISWKKSLPRWPIVPGETSPAGGGIVLQSSQTALANDHWNGKGQSPEEVLLHAADPKHTSHITSYPYQLDAKMSSFFNDLIAIVRILWWSSIRIPLDISWY